MSLSTNTLFHFTRTIDNIENILQKVFHPNFSLEDFNIINQNRSKNPKLEFAIPMVSFCDIPLSQVSVHLSFYGNYGIGLRKEWGMKHGITPVLYTYKKSRLARQLSSMAKAIIKIDPEHTDGNPAMDRFYDLSCFVKPYQGRPFRNGILLPNKRFYDEREWRYVPRLPAGQFRFGLPKEEFLDSTIREMGNHYLWDNYQLRFSPADIKYIVVASENEILNMIHIVEDAKSKFPRDQIKTLISRIVSAKQIIEDF
jgi:hypothetical protein